MSVFSRDKATRLIELLGQETELFRQMLKHTEAQTELIEKDEIDAFNESLDRRQELIENINVLHQESQSLMQSYISYSSSTGGRKSKSIDTAAASLRELISACAELNEKNIAAAKVKTQSYTERIDKLSTSRKGIGSYILGGSSDSELFDRKM